METGAIISMIKAYLLKITPAFIGALIGSGYVQSLYKALPSWQRVSVGVFTMCFAIFVGVPAWYTFYQPSGLDALVGAVVAGISIPFFKWLTSDSRKIFNRITDKILGSSEEKSVGDK